MDKEQREVFPHHKTKPNMETIVKIEWDKPEDRNWLNQLNIEIALSAYCKNTKFKVTELNPALQQETNNKLPGQREIDRQIEIYRLEKHSEGMPGSDQYIAGCEVGFSEGTNWLITLINEYYAKESLQAEEPSIDRGDSIGSQHGTYGFDEKLIK